MSLDVILDVHIGITREALAVDAIKSASNSWTTVHELRDCKNIWELRSRGYKLGNSNYVSFVDDDDVYLDLELIKTEIEQNTPAFFCNSLLTYVNKNATKYISDPTWSGLSSFLRKPAHNPYFVRRDIINIALDNAYKNILRDKNITNCGVDLAIAFEIQRLVGWKYLPTTAYHWRQSPDSDSISRDRMSKYYEVFRYYSD